MSGHITPAGVRALVEEGFASTAQEALAMLEDMGEEVLDEDDLLEAKWALEDKVERLSRAVREADERADVTWRDMHQRALDAAMAELAQVTVELQGPRS